MDLQHFEGAVCLASFGQIWSRSPRQVTDSSTTAVRLQVSSRKLLWCDFSLNQCCRSTDWWLLGPWCSQSTPRSALQTEYSSNLLNDQVPGKLHNQPIRRQHVMCNHIHCIVFACFFFSHMQEELCSGSMVHLEFFFNHPVLGIIRFSCQLIFNKLLYTESVDLKPLPTLTKLLHGLSLESDGGDNHWYEEAKKEKWLRN